MKAAPQIELEFGDGLRAQEVCQETERAIVELVDAISLKEAAWRVGVTSPTLHKKLHRQERNQLSLREAVILLASSPAHVARAALEPLVRAVGCELVEAHPLKPEEELERLMSALDAEMTPAAKERLLRKARIR